MLEKVIGTIVATIIFFVIKKASDHYFKQFRESISDKDYKTFVSWMYKAIWISLFVFFVFILLQAWGIEITPLLTGLGILSIILGLALQSTLSNLFSGISLILDNSVRIGDIIALPEKNIIGVLEEINWRSAKIKTFENNIIYIPNSILANSLLINYSRPTDHITIWFEVGVSYFDDLDFVEKVTLEVARKVQKSIHGDENWEPKILYKQFGDSNIIFNVILRAKNYISAKYLVHNFIKELKRVYDEKGIEISFPNVNVFMRSEK